MILNTSQHTPLSGLLGESKASSALPLLPTAASSNVSPDPAGPAGAIAASVGLVCCGDLFLGEDSKLRMLNLLLMGWEGEV